jgi:hypothetical protein
LTNLTVSIDPFDRLVYWLCAELSVMPYDRLDALRSADGLRLGFLDCDGVFVLIRECIPRPTALISCTHSVADHGKLSGMAYMWISSAVSVRDVMQCEPWLRDLNRFADRQVADAVAELVSAFGSAGIRPPMCAPRR